ncbi:type II and III secretion system protein [Salmonella enterica subsp. enterica serovar Javiana]|uniref:Type II and III secretion system protein n=1 Tax=Salmonella enterica subsp. enterica serovar Javiana TaxID=363569 RepID=A0A733VEQ8_SALET|nr:type II and III secretion system protein [Salmonella enterica subsp. enterica serovar Javiana]EBA9399122.1 type II and III secretion system protein [Salmonella enterica]ECB4607788.1 type II and III secretion system protein [Salmonella enterica subsp. enterica serovar Braenderup]ECD6768000.1 type II and III secretion system protein [Salmonella enterica subsp. enterica serovar Newport]EHE0685209.1 type II and III secretion system protein [Salmonella enterica subsp. enterica serovar Eastbourne]
MNVKHTLSCFVTVLLLQGCTTDFNHKYTDKDLLDSSPGLQGLDAQKQQAFMKYDTSFLGKPVVYSAKQQQLLARHVEFRSEIPVSINTVLETLSAQTKTSYRLNDQPPGKNTQQDNPGGEPLIRDNSVNFSGTFEEFMRYLSALYDVTVTLTDDNILQVNVYNTYALKLDFFGKDNQYDSSLDLSGNEAISGGVKGKSESKFQSTFWDDVTAMAQKYVSSGVYNVFKDVGVLTFSGRPSEYTALAGILKDYKQANSKQFVITYKVFILDKKKLRNLDGELGLKFKSGGTSLNLNSGLIGTPSGDIYFGRDFYADGRLGVAAKLDALYQLTGSKVLQSGTMVTRNNSPVPLNLTESQNYVSGITSTLSDTIGGSFSSSVTTATITTGTSVILTPRVLSDGRVELTSAYTKKNLNGIDVFPQGATSDQNQVQLPNISTTELFNTVDVTPGSLIIVGKYETKVNTDDQGLKILGGNLNRNDSTSTVVMVVGVDYYNKPFQEGR